MLNFCWLMVIQQIVYADMAHILFFFFLKTENIIKIKAGQDVPIQVTTGKAKNSK
jgi:hypothetical protein